MKGRAILSELVSLLDDIRIFHGFGFQGRVEMIDPRAISPQSLPIQTVGRTF
jgi:hypothetical protein